MEETMMNDDMNEKKENIAVAERTKGHVLDVGPGCMAVELPCGFLYEGAVYSTAVVKEMSGREEDILAGRGPIVARLNAIISNCIISIGTITDKKLLSLAVDNMGSQDREAIFIAIRRISLGDFYDCFVNCPSCQFQMHKSIDLKDIEIVAMPDRMMRERTVEAPSGKKVKWHVLMAKDEQWLTEQKKKKDDILTLGILARVDEVDEEKLDRNKKYRESVEILKSMSARDRNFLRKDFEDNEGNVNRRFEFDCDNCKHEWTADLDIGQTSFFFPSAT